MLRYCLICLSLLTTSSAFSKNEDKGYKGIHWGEDYKIVLKQSPAKKHNQKDCNQLLKQFPLKLKLRKYIDAKNIFPGLALSQERETPERSYQEIQSRYKVERGLNYCHIFFDDKFVGHFQEFPGSSSYKDEIAPISSQWGPPLQENSDCEENCVDKYRVYFHNKGDTNVLVIITPFKKAQFFFYSKNITHEIEKAVVEITKGK